MLEHELTWRLGIFIGLLLLLAAAEALAPRRKLSCSRTGRWRVNLSLVAIDSLLLRIVFPAAAVGWAASVHAQGWGLAPLLALPEVAVIALAVVMLDLSIYWQHRLMHAVPLLWRLHRVHHSDLDFDVTTGVRFHPVEILLSMLWKMLMIAALGADPLAVMVFELLLSATSLWEHANLRLPSRLDSLLRWITVTPDMHRIHHSVHRVETDSNFGFNLALWDRLFGSYTQQPRDGQQGMTIGLPAFREAPQQGLGALLMQPLQND